MVTNSPWLQCLPMNKRKIQINQLKKTACKGKKVRTINVKYETVLSYFKQKDSKDLPVFMITFMPLISDLLAQLNATELVDKIQSESKEAIRTLPPLTTTLKLESFELKALSKQYPIQQICSCLYVQGHDKRILSIHRSKLMSFFKHLRVVYADFCYCAGQKIIVEPSQLRILYELFVAQWNKNQQKGRMNAVERIERKLCRSLYFLGILIENNILEAIQSAQRRKKEEESDLGTKSEHKKNIKGVNQQVSTVHSFASLDPSNLSARLKSENSQEETFPVRNNLSQYSQKSQKVISKSRFQLWDKAEIRNLSFTLDGDLVAPNSELQVPKYQINYLSNDVENILIEQAFKMQKFTDSCQRNETVSPYQYCLVDYSGSHSQQQYQYGNYYIGNYFPYSYGDMGYQHHFPQQYVPTYEYPADDTADLNQLKRSLNLVQTRKKDKDRYQ